MGFALGSDHYALFVVRHLHVEAVWRATCVYTQGNDHTGAQSVTRASPRGQLWSFISDCTLVKDPICVLSVEKVSFLREDCWSIHDFILESAHTSVSSVGNVTLCQKVWFHTGESTQGRNRMLAQCVKSSLAIRPGCRDIC